MGRRAVVPETTWEAFVVYDRRRGRRRRRFVMVVSRWFMMDEWECVGGGCDLHI
jgi:hypothetical protein